MARILDEHRLTQLVREPVDSGLYVGQRGASEGDFRQS
jgi:hypothetical protein